MRDTPDGDRLRLARAAVPTGALIPEPAGFTWTGNGVIDAWLGRVQRLSGGRLDAVLHVASYLTFGSVSALVNLVALHVLYYLVVMPFTPPMHYLVAYAGATEISTFTNFALNDHYTFRRLPGHQRVWPARLVRYHTTCLFGVLVTFLLSTALYALVGLPLLLSQATAILVVMVLNFTMHHVWTYRQRHAPAL